MGSFLRLKIPLVIVTCLCLVACGGGGGGGGSGGSGAKDGVRVLHGAIDATPLGMTIDGNDSGLLSRFSFGTSRVFPGNGDHQLELHSTLGGSSIYSSVVSFSKGDRLSVLLYGSLEAGGLNIALLPDSPPVVESGTGAVKLINSVVGAQSITGVFGQTGLGEALFGDKSEYISVQPGISQISVHRASDNQEIFTQAVEILDGKSYTLFMSGEVHYLVVGRLLND